MAVRGKISPGASVRIEFSTPGSNPGTSVVASGLIGTDDRQSQASSLIPGGPPKEHHHQDPGAIALRLHLDVPSGGGTIGVRVFANGAPLDEGSVDRDQFWTYLVQ